MDSLTRRTTIITDTHKDLFHWVIERKSGESGPSNDLFGIRRRNQEATRHMVRALVHSGHCVWSALFALTRNQLLTSTGS